MTKSLGWGFWLTFIIGFAWSLYRTLSNQGWILDDELAHFLISKDVWTSPDQLWHTWSRPGRNLLQFIPAYFGLEAARLWTLTLSAVAVWLTGLEAKRLEMPALWILPLLIWFQWWFPELSYPVLTQGPFLLVWIAGVFFAVRDQHVRAAICWGYLGLIRHEGIALSALWGLWVIFSEQGFARHLIYGRFRESAAAFPRALVLGFWTILPMALMNLFTWLANGTIPFAMFFDSEPTDHYGSGPLWLYSQHLMTGVGLPIALLMLLGLFWRGWKLRWDLVLYATYPAYLIMHSIIFWKGLFASGGYYHFIMPMAPWAGLLALRGLNRLTDRFGQKPLYLILPLTVWGGLAMLQQQFMVQDSHIKGLPEKKATIKPICPPMEFGRFATGLKEASDWVRENVTDQKWLTHHAAASYFLHDFQDGEKVDPWGGVQENGPDTWEPYSPANLPPGTVLIWDTQYSVDFHGFTLEALEKAHWHQAAQYTHDTVRIFIKE